MSSAKRPTLLRETTSRRVGGSLSPSATSTSGQRGGHGGYSSSSGSSSQEDEGSSGLLSVRTNNISYFNRGDSNASSSSGGSSIYSHSSESSLPVTPSESSSPTTPPLATLGGETVCDFVFDEGGDEDYSEYRNLIAKYGANRIEAALKRSPETPPLSAADSASATATSFDITSIVPPRAANRNSNRRPSHDDVSAVPATSSSSSRPSQRSASRDGLNYTRSRGHRLSVSWSSNVTVHDAPSISDLTHERAESGYHSAGVSPNLGPTACDVPAELPHMCQSESHAHSRRRRYPTSPRSARYVFDQSPSVQVEDGLPPDRF